jgi:hypothetical protein
VAFSTFFDVAAHGNGESEGLNGKAADHESCALGGCGKQHKRGDREEKSGWHNQQSGVFHGHSFSNTIIQ